jgi:carboxylesterase
VHGLTGTIHEMAFVAHYLYKEGYSVFCPSLPRHDQPLEVLRKVTWKDCYLAMRQAFLDIRSRTGARFVFAAGLSLGALLVLLLADEFAEQLAAVSCLAPTLFYDGWNTPLSRCLLPLVYATPLKHWFYFKEESPYGIKDEALRNRVHSYYSKAELTDTSQMIQYGYPYIPVSLMYQNHLLFRHLRKRLSGIRVPVQLIQSDQDDMASFRNSQYIYDRISSEIKEIIPLHDSYHVITVDRERERVGQEMDRFFRKIARGHSSDNPLSSYLPV